MTLELRMREAAHAFVEANGNQALDGPNPFDYTSASVAALEEWISVFIACSPPPEVVHSCAVAMGAYLGEILVRSGKARWTEEMPGRAPLRLVGEDTVAFPLDKVAKRLALGAEHDLRAFVAVAWNGPIRSALPPGVQATVSALPNQQAAYL